MGDRDRSVTTGRDARSTSARAISTLYAVPGSGVAASSDSRSHGIGAAPESAIRVWPPMRAAATPTSANDQRFRSIAFR